MECCQIQGSQEVFIFTGAGISTSMGIPDFRGPNGIWTARKKKQPISALRTPFEYSRPSFTHMAIAALVAAGKVKCVCSQNVDCLHLRSGISRSLLAELHGNCFAERCEACKREYTRDFQVETVNFQPTGRLCVAPECGSKDAKADCRPPSLLDNVLDWDSALPDDELDAAIDAAKRSELTLVLGSSLQISPANEIPTLTPQTKRGKGKEKGKMVIVNLQKTPKDRSAHMLVRARVDPVFSRIMLQLGLSVPPYVRLDGLVLSHAQLPAEAAATPPASSTSTWGFKLALHSVHGQACVMPMVRSAKLELLQDDGRSGSQAHSLYRARVQLLCSAWPLRQQQAPTTNQQTSIGTADPGAGGIAASGDADLAAPRTESGTAPCGDADVVAPHAVCAAGGQGSGYNEATADAGASLGRQDPSHTPCAQAAGSCAAVAPSSSAASAPNGGPLVFSVSCISLELDQVRCRISLQLVPWADPDKQRFLLPEYVVQRELVPPLDQDAYQAACSVPAPQQNSQGDGGSHGAHTDSTMCGLLAGLPSDFEVALAMDAAGLGLLPCHAHTAPPGAWGGSKQELLPATGAGAKPAGVGVKQEQEATMGPSEGPTLGGVKLSEGHAAGGCEQAEGASHPPAAPAGPGGSSDSSSRSGAAGPCPIIAAAGQCFKVITYVSQEQRYNAAQVWEDFQANPPPVKLAKVRGAASEDGAKDAKRARRGASDEAGAEALAAGLRRSERQRKPAQPQQLDTDTEDVNEPRGVPTGDNWEPVPLHGDEAGSE
mmetsp:Transcript_25737/g.69860  ORF Transcript_25737/g.69860 Transcript_25737/m.69860 type:complete len:772 (+) Transcript_25737:32-2347(+)